MHQGYKYLNISVALFMKSLHKVIELYWEIINHNDWNDLENWFPLMTNWKNFRSKF